MNIRIERSVIDVTTLPHLEVSPKWRHVDAAGHEHRLVDGELPTLKKVVDATYSHWCPDCHDDHVDEEWHWECLQCGEKIEPGTRIVSGPQYIPGPVRYFIDDLEVTEEEAMKAIHASS